MKRAPSISPLGMLVETASKFIGVQEDQPNQGYWIEEFQKAVDGIAGKEPYCAGFVVYCLNEVERLCGSEPLIYKSENAVQMWEKSPKAIRVTVPTPGCIMIWQMFDPYGRPLRAGHCGIVKSVTQLGYVNTIEANTGPGKDVTREGEGVFEKKRSFSGSSSMRVLGWLLPWV